MSHIPGLHLLQGIGKLSPAHLRQSLSWYANNAVRADLVAGLSVAVMGVPQAMAYALIAGLPPIYGIYTAIIPCFVAALLGCSNHLVTGPTNAVCVVILSLTASLPDKYGVSHIEIVLALTFLTGVFQFLFGFLKLGGIAKYVSNSVIVGFTAGAGILIGVNQLKSLMGVTLGEGEGGHFLLTLLATLRRIPETNPHTLLIGVITILMLLGFRRWARQVPGSLVAVIVLSLLGYWAGWFDPDLGDSRVRIVRDIQEITPTFDIFMVPQMFLQPNLDLITELMGGAVALAILGLVESTSISRAIATRSGQRLDFNREFAAQGAAKMVGSFFHCFAATGSFTRSAVCYQSGGKTRMAAIHSALFTALTLALFGPLANYIPLSTLAGIIMVTAFTMVQRDRLAMTWRSGRNSQIVMGGTLAATLLMPLENAVFVGVLLSIVILLRVTSKPDLTQLVQHPDYGFEEVPFKSAAPAPITVINLEGDLYFAAAEDLDYELLQALKPGTRAVVLRMKRLRAVGSSAMAMLEHFHQLLAQRGIHLIVCGIESEMVGVLTGSGLRKLIGEQNIFYADNRIFQSTELAVARALSIVEMEESRTENPSDDSQREKLLALQVHEIMQRRCLRFGSQHQIREAMWLISQFQQRMNTLHPQTVFLQNKFGKLCAEVSVHSLLKYLAQAVPEGNLSGLTDEQLAESLRPLLFRDILQVAHREPLSLLESTPLTQAFARAAEHGFRPMPVDDAHGRLRGVFDEMAMLRGLTRILQNEESRTTDKTDQPA